MIGMIHLRAAVQAVFPGVNPWSRHRRRAVFFSVDFFYLFSKNAGVPRSAERVTINLLRGARCRGFFFFEGSPRYTAGKSKNSGRGPWKGCVDAVLRVIVFPFVFVTCSLI